jgi:tetratricopeptide (TPR) repeat protein
MPWSISRICIALASLQILFPLSSSGCHIEPDPSAMIYRAFVEEKIELWEEAMLLLELNYKRSGSREVLYELALARYGYIGYSLAAGNKPAARKFIALAEENINRLIRFPEFESSAYAMQAALYAYHIFLSPWKAVMYVRRCKNLIDKAIETDPENPAGWIENGNALYYAPASMGGSRAEAAVSYSKAVQLLESNMQEHHKWLYLNSLAGLARSYQASGNKQKAIDTCHKALEFEPEFKWIREKILPGLLASPRS